MTIAQISLLTVLFWCYKSTDMSSTKVRFGVEIDRDVDAGIQRIAVIEERSKKKQHAVFMRRIVELWREAPEKLKELRFIR